MRKHKGLLSIRTSRREESGDVLGLVSLEFGIATSALIKRWDWHGHKQHFREREDAGRTTNDEFAK